MHSNRRYDMDWIRVIAIGLLLVYHVAIGFQPWGSMIAFITNSDPWPSLWLPMSMLNVWRIPLLFLVSGMGVNLALQNRNWKQLLAERSLRILLPLVFGALCIVPLHWLLWQRHHHLPSTYVADLGHLWFLGNIFVYTLLLLPLLVFVKNKSSKWFGPLRKAPSAFVSVLVMVGAFAAEAVAFQPRPFELYAFTWHGFALGMVAFIFGYYFVLVGDSFWRWASTNRWWFVSAGMALFVLRTFVLETSTPIYLISVESAVWILSVLALGHRYLNRPNRALPYLREAAYPMYILHMFFLYLGAMLIFPLPIAAPAKFLLQLVFVLVGCFTSFEIIRRFRLLRLLFGLGWTIRTKPSKR